MKYPKNIIFTSLIIGTLFLQACSSSKSEQLHAEDVPHTQLAFATALAFSPEYNVSLPGELKPYEQVELHAKVSGFVQGIYVDRGTKVHKGQLLAILDAPEISQQYLSAKAEEAKLEQEFIFAQQSKKRLQKANEMNGAVAATEMEQAESNYQRTKATFEAAKAKTAAAAQLQKYLRITAPFNGIITERNTSEGALVNNQSPYLFSLAQTQRLRLTIAIPEKQATSLQDDTKVEFTVSSQPGKVFSAKLSRNSKVIQSNGRALVAEFDVHNSDALLNGGEYAQVQIKLQRKTESVFVPISSIVRAQSGTFVWKADPNEQLIRVDIKEGIQQDSLREVFGNIQAGDRILQKGTEEAQRKPNKLAQQ